MDWKSPQDHILELKNALRQRFQIIRGGFIIPIKTGIPERFWLAFFLAGFALGLGIKELASTNFTIGYDDYRLPPKERLFDLNASREKALVNGSELTEPKQKTEYPHCLFESQ